MSGPTASHDFLFSTPPHGKKSALFREMERSRKRLVRVVLEMLEKDHMNVLFMSSSSLTIVIYQAMLLYSLRYSSEIDVLCDDRWNVTQRFFVRDFLLMS